MVRTNEDCFFFVSDVFYFISFFFFCLGLRGDGFDVSSVFFCFLWSSCLRLFKG